MITFTKEQLIASAHARIEFAEMMLAGELEPLKERTWSIELELARIALASLEAEKCAEPVAFINGAWTLVYYRPPKELGLKIGDKLFTAPPAPVSVPDDEQCKPHPVMAVKGELVFLDHFNRIIDERNDDIDIGQLGSGNHEALMLAALDAFRAAILQGADTELQRKASIHDALCEKYNVESLADFVDWQRNHIAELEATPPAPVGPGETAVMPDYPGYAMTQRECFQAGEERAAQKAWVACSERMPETDGNYWGWWSESKRQGPVWFIKSELQAQFQSSEITHWMPLPAEPQQEVK